MLADLPGILGALIVFVGSLVALERFEQGDPPPSRGTTAGVDLEDLPPS